MLNAHRSRPLQAPTSSPVEGFHRPGRVARFDTGAEPTTAPARRADVAASKPLIAAIAHELWKLHGGNDVLNWLEAEILLQSALADLDDPASATSRGDS